MNDKLTREGMLDYINGLIARAGCEKLAPYYQLEEIVEEHFTRRESIESIKAQIEHDQKFLRPFKSKQQNRGVDPKPTVTREWLSDRVDKEWAECEYQSNKYPHGPETYDVKALVITILKELDVEVEE